jgi:hypothetical protein
MDVLVSFGNGPTHDEFTRLKDLAGVLLAAETVDLQLLDDIAALAGTVATHYRDAARRRLLDAVSRDAATLFEAAPADLEARLANLPFEELADLERLLAAAATARADLAETDRDLMAAHRRRDFAAMAPLALAADRQNSALSAAGAQFCNRTGIDAALRPVIPEPAVEADQVADDKPIADADPEPEAGDEVEPALRAPDPVNAADLTPVAENACDTGAPLKDERQPAPVERRRIRDLIRQARPTAEEAAA